MSRRDPRRPLFELLGSSLRTWHHLSDEDASGEDEEEARAVRSRSEEPGTGRQKRRSSFGQVGRRADRRGLHVTWSAELYSELPDLVANTADMEHGHTAAGPDGDTTSAAEMETEFPPLHYDGSTASGGSLLIAEPTVVSDSELTGISGTDSGGARRRSFSFGDSAEDSVGFTRSAELVDSPECCDPPRSGRPRPLPSPRLQRSGSSSSAGSFSRELYEEAQVFPGNKVGGRWRPELPAGE